MNDSEIRELLADYERYHLPSDVIEHHFMLALVKLDDPDFLLKVPEPFRSRIIEFGMKVGDQWFVLSSAGTVDYSEHAPKLHALVARFLENVPVGKHLRWNAPKR